MHHETCIREGLSAVVGRASAARLFLNIYILSRAIDPCVVPHPATTSVTVSPATWMGPSHVRGPSMRCPRCSRIPQGPVPWDNMPCTVSRCDASHHRSVVATRLWGSRWARVAAAYLPIAIRLRIWRIAARALSTLLGVRLAHATLPILRNCNERTPRSSARATPRLVVRCGRRGANSAAFLPTWVAADALHASPSFLHGLRSASFAAIRPAGAPIPHRTSHAQARAARAEGAIA